MSIRISDQKKRKAVQKALEWIKANSTVQADGSIKWGDNHINDSLARFIITQNVKSSGNVSISERTHRRTINLAINRWLKHKKYYKNDDLIAAFFEALKIEINQLERNRKTFYVLMFLNLYREDLSKIEPISILGDEIIVKGWNELSFLNIDELWEQVKFHLWSNPIVLDIKDEKLIPKASLFQPVLLTVDAYDSDDALAIASDRLNIFRAILNISDLYSRFTHFRPYHKPISIVFSSPIYATFDQSGRFVEVYQLIEKYDYNRKKLTEKQFSGLKFFLPFFEQELNYPQITHHVLKLLRLYQDATDASFPSSAFLTMWQVLETAVTFKDEEDGGLKQVEIVARISRLLNLDNSLFRNALNTCRDLRNDLAHQGQYVEDGDQAFFALKLIAESCIGRLLALSKDLETIHDIREYLNLPRKKKELARIKKVISWLENSPLEKKK